MPFNHLISVVPFSSLLQSFPASGSFQMSQFYASDSQTIGVSASASVLPRNIQDWFPLGLTGLISLLPKGLSRVSSSSSLKLSALQCSAFFMVQLSHIYMITGKTITLTISIFVGKVISLLSNMPFIIITCLKCCRKSKRCGVRRPFSNDLSFFFLILFYF